MKKPLMFTEKQCPSCIGRALQSRRKQETVRCANCGVEFVRFVRKSASPNCRACQAKIKQRVYRKRKRIK